MSTRAAILENDFGVISVRLRILVDRGVHERHEVRARAAQVDCIPLPL